VTNASLALLIGERRVEDGLALHHLTFGSRHLAFGTLGAFRRPRTKRRGRLRPGM
jgi:hypothetical protein